MHNADFIVHRVAATKAISHVSQTIIMQGTRQQCHHNNAACRRAQCADANRLHSDQTGGTNGPNDKANDRKCPASHIKPRRVFIVKFVPTTRQAAEQHTG